MKTFCIAILLVSSAFAQIISKNLPSLLYTHQTLPETYAQWNYNVTNGDVRFMVDNPIATLKDDNGDWLLLGPEAGEGNVIFRGDKEEPFREVIWDNNNAGLYTWFEHYNANGTSYGSWPILDYNFVYLMNAYLDTTTNKLIGFFHVEHNGTCDTVARMNWCNRRQYSIALGVSTDRGYSWTYYGDIIRTQKRGDCHSPFLLDGKCNIGGIPLIFKNDSVYAYYQEMKKRSVVFAPNGVDTLINTLSYMSVAKASLSDIIESINSIPDSLLRTPVPDSTTPSIFEDNNIFLFKKYDGVGWSIDALTGQLAGAPIKFPDNIMYDGITNKGRYLFDSHGDAVTLPNGQYAMALNSYHDSTVAIYLYSSTDGITWRNPIRVSDKTGFTKDSSMYWCFMFPSIYGSEGSSDDGLFSDGKFSVLFQHFDSDSTHLYPDSLVQHWLQDFRATGTTNIYQNNAYFRTDINYNTPNFLPAAVYNTLF